MDTENSKTNESYKFIYFTDKLNLKPIPLVKLSIYYTWKNIKFACNNNKSKISVLTWNDEFGFTWWIIFYFRHVQDYFEYIIKKHKTIADNSPIKIYINKTVLYSRLKQVINYNHC